MRLTKLTLHGFKSFADATEFTFDHPVTGVVGPNGCGKSNVVDAIKWVLGERSSKSLRGHEMIDVIFAGSGGRRPMGVASVKLTFDNPVVELPGRAHDEPGAAIQAEVETEVESCVGRGEEVGDGVEAVAEQGQVATRQESGRRGRRLPVESDVVEIERRLSRDGVSDYLINGKSARLKDIRELFLDTGVGADAYSIIEQGKVDAMLMASPQERRVIFEEAAGIAKYKQRRIEAQRKLDRAEQNLKVTKDELESTERRLRLVRGQAAKARKFAEFDQELKAWRTALALDQFDELQTRIDGLTSRQAELGSQREASHAELSDLEYQKQQRDTEREHAVQAQQELEQQRLSAMHAMEQASQRRTMLERLVEQTKRESQSDEQLQHELQERQQSSAVAIVEQQESIAGLAEKLGEAERRLHAAGSERAAMLEALNDAQRESGQRQASAAKIDRERIQLLASLDASGTRITQLTEQLSRLAGSASNAAQEREQVERQIAQATQQRTTHEARVRELESTLASHEQEVARLGTDRQTRASEVTRLDQDLVRLESRCAVLSEMDQARVGFAEAVRRAMVLRERGEAFGGVIAPLADLLETRQDVDSDASLALELGLGEDLQSLVVASLAELPTQADVARVEGTLTFLTLAHTHATSAADEIEAIAGIGTTNVDARVVSLRTLVRARGQDERTSLVNTTLDRLMSGLYLVCDLDAAVLLASGPMAGCTFVTRAGEVLDAKGRIRMGSMQQSASDTGRAGLLGRRAELESLTREASQLREVLDAARAALEGVDTEASEIAQRASAVRVALSQEQRLALSVQGTLERFSYQLQRLDRDREQGQRESEQAQARLTAIEIDCRSLRERAQSLGRLAEEETAAATASAEHVAGLHVQATMASEHVTTAKVEVGTLSEQLSGARRELSRCEAARDDAARRLRDVQGRLAMQQER
jgi:chromosome segregation protein